jgi:hypothetical protein
MSHALTRKYAHYLALLWDKGSTNLTLNEKEVLVDICLSIIFFVGSHITINRYSNKKR